MAHCQASQGRCHPSRNWGIPGLVCLDAPPTLPPGFHSIRDGISHTTGEQGRHWCHDTLLTSTRHQRHPALQRHCEGTNCNPRPEVGATCGSSTDDEGQDTSCRDHICLITRVATTANTWDAHSVGAVRAALYLRTGTPVECVLLLQICRLICDDKALNSMSNIAP